MGRGGGKGGGGRGGGGRAGGGQRADDGVVSVAPKASKPSFSGSEKQNQWAANIWDAKKEDFADLRSKMVSPVGEKAVDFIQSNTSSSFWIDNRNFPPRDMVYKLFTSGLQIRGNQQSDIARMDRNTGKITVTRQVIVQDKKGGRMETVTQVF